MAEQQPDEFEQLDEHVEHYGGSGGSYYDRKGLPITLGEWCRRTQNPSYRRIAETDLGTVWISTVWLGLDHNFGNFGLALPGETSDSRPLIFETKIFLQHGGELGSACRTVPEVAGQTWHYATVEEALKGHEAAVSYILTEAFQCPEP